MKSPDCLEAVFAEPPIKRLDALNRGLPSSVFPGLARQLNLSSAGLATVLGLSERTLRSRTTTPRSRLTGDEAERAFRAFRVFKRAKEVLGDEDAARAWLATPQRAVANRAPLALLTRDVGADEVLNVLGAIGEGVYL